MPTTHPPFRADHVGSLLRAPELRQARAQHAAGTSWIAQGGSEPVADILFNCVNIDGYFMEWDTDRAGGFEPLRYLPKPKKMVVLGLVTSKSGKLESKDDLKRRIDETAKYADLDQLCLSSQCGFAPPKREIS